MRESFGGTFMLQLSLVFLVIYICFMAVAINYAKTFRIKNGIINIVEQNSGLDKKTVGLVEDYLERVGYNVTNLPTSEKNDCEKANGTFFDRGVCIYPADSKASYYIVTTYIAVDFPFFDLSMRLRINGETESFNDWRTIE